MDLVRNRQFIKHLKIVDINGVDSAECRRDRKTARKTEEENKISFTSPRVDYSDIKLFKEKTKTTTERIRNKLTILKQNNKNNVK